ncbi:MnhB domain-containing protein [Petroclostridium sp. X23]|uniref:MnhB domain-containing protein n=1 Tax=Petroclostridium sp. X23 TaxID=3045146 RepID=UPI0024ADB68E|nr:MnhB domain-containing protein [Petroclostridium sp. X23]WHH57699.1 MnhB domain-containing protein [Petroclostridium sp. X23]
MNENSEIISIMIGMMYPFILLFGFYIILNGHLTPGGGFQGGAILSAVFMSRYLVRPVQDIRLNSLQMLEKMIYVLIIAIPLVFLLLKFNFMYPFLNRYYLVAMNALIGIKVCCGLSIVFFRFVFYESR